MKRIYPAIIHNDTDGFWLEFPDLKGCMTDGDTLNELIENAEDALGAYLASRIENGLEINDPSDINEINSGNEAKTYISTEVNQYRRDTKAVKKMLSVPAWLAKEAELQNISLSKVLQEALQEKLNIA